MAMLPSIDPEYPFPYSYTYTFQGLPWNQRALNLIGSGKVFNEYLGKGPLNAQNDRMVVMLAQSAIVDIEITIKDLKQKSFHESIGYIWRETACLLDSPRQEDAVKLGLWRTLLRLTFPSSELDLLAIRKWPLWMLKAYIPGNGNIINVEFNAGKVQYIEAQSGRIKDFGETLKHVRTERVALVRTDNLRFSERAKNFVTKTTRK